MDIEELGGYVSRQIEYARRYMQKREKIPVKCVLHYCALLANTRCASLYYVRCKYRACYGAI